MSIILGSDYIYNKNLCNLKKYILTVPLSKILNQIKKVLLSLNIEVVKPFLSDRSFTKVVFPAPDGDERITIIPSLIGGIKN